jgi:hypothetical protein
MLVIVQIKHKAMEIVPELPGKLIIKEFPTGTRDNFNY